MQIALKIAHKCTFFALTIVTDTKKVIFYDFWQFLVVFFGTYIKKRGFSIIPVFLINFCSNSKPIFMQNRPKIAQIDRITWPTLSISIEMGNCVKIVHRIGHFSSISDRK